MGDAKSASSSAIVKVDSKKDNSPGGEDFDYSAAILYADDEVPFGPLGIFPENYSDLQAKVGYGTFGQGRDRPRSWVCSRYEYKYARTHTEGVFVGVWSGVGGQNTALSDLVVSWYLLSLL